MGQRSTQWANGLPGYSWDLTPAQREQVHGEMIPPNESTYIESWSHPGEPERVHASPNHAREEIFPNQIP